MQQLLRRLSALCFVLGALFAPGYPAMAESPAQIDMTASSVALYQGRQVLTADGGVAVKTGSRTITASHAILYLREGRLVIAGGVSVKDAGTEQDGLSYALDLTTGNGLLLVSAAPQRVLSDTNGSFAPVAKAVDARTFLASDVAGTQPDATSQHATIRPGVSIVLTPAVVGNAGTAQTVASYAIPLAPPHARDFGPSPAYGAALEYPFRVDQSRDWFTYGRLRYDKYLGGAGIGLETHYAPSERGYVALAATQDADGARYDVLAFQNIEDGLTQTVDLSRGVDLRYMRYALNAFGPHGTASLSTAQSGWSRSDDLYLSTNRHPLWHALTYRFEGDAGHDVHPGDYNVAQDGRGTLGLALESVAFQVAQAAVSTQAYFDGTDYTYGRKRFVSTYASWLTRQFGTRLLANAGYSLSQTNDTVGQYPRGTQRTYQLGGTYQSRSWSLFSSVQYARDFPQFYQYGRPLFFQTLALRVKRKRGPAVEIDSSFGYGGLGSAPRPTLGLRLVP